MILTTFSEEQTLSELIKDYSFVKRQAKKFADVYLKDKRKRGVFIREDEFDFHQITTSSSNKWFVAVVYNQTKKIPWRFCACCVVEGNKKTKDFYLVRGMNTEQPYYVKVTSHAIKRYNERNNIDTHVGYIMPEAIACILFEHRETAICLKFIDFKFHMLLNKIKDASEIEGMSHIILTNRGIYYGLRSSLGNYTFKTYISTKMSVNEVKILLLKKETKWEQEAQHVLVMISLHQYYNKWLYDEEDLDKFLYQQIDRDAELTLNDNSSVFLLRH